MDGTRQSRTSHAGHERTGSAENGLSATAMMYHPWAFTHLIPSHNILKWCSFVGLTDHEMWLASNSHCSSSGLHRCRRQRRRLEQPAKQHLEEFVQWQRLNETAQESPTSRPEAVLRSCLALTYMSNPSRSINIPTVKKVSCRRAVSSKLKREVRDENQVRAWLLARAMMLRRNIPSKTRCGVAWGLHYHASKRRGLSYLGLVCLAR